ncbi:MAG: hypothetical protein RJA56_1770, partial [Pseudomonadota bacterium]
MALITNTFPRAHHVGSFIRPQDLLDARANHATGKITREQLMAVQTQAIQGVVKMQESLGLQVITDGEFNRGSWQRDFLLEFDNVA